MSESRLDDLERRVRDLEIRVMNASRVVTMLSFFSALRIKSGSHLIDVANALKGAEHTDIKDPAEQALFVKRTNESSSALRAMGESVESIFKGKRESEQKLQEVQLKKKIEEVLDNFHFEVLPVRTITEE